MKKYVLFSMMCWFLFISAEHDELYESFVAYMRTVPSFHHRVEVMKRIEHEDRATIESVSYHKRDGVSTFTVGALEHADQFPVEVANLLKYIKEQMKNREDVHKAAVDNKGNCVVYEYSYRYLVGTEGVGLE